MVKTVLQVDGFEWIDVSLPERHEITELEQKYQLPKEWVENCLNPKTLPKYESRIEGERPQEFFIIRVFDEKTPAKADTVLKLTRKVAFFIQKQRIITIHKLPFHVLQTLVQRIPFKNQQQILADVMRMLFRSYDIPLENAELQLENLETIIFKRTKLHLPEIHVLRRQISIIRRMLGHGLEITQKYSAEFDQNVPHLIRLKEDIQQDLFQADLLLEGATHLMNLQLAMEEQKRNEVMKILTVFSAFFLPLTFIVGVYGMNFEFMPEIHWENGYMFAWGLMLAVTLTISLWFRRRGWLNF